MKNLKLKKITSFMQFILLKSEWNALLSKSNNDCIFLRHEWFKAWWQSFGDQKELLVLLIREEGELVGIAPLMKLRERYRGLPARVIRFIENDESPRSNLIVKKNRLDVIRFLLQFLSNMNHEWDIIILKNILLEESDLLKVVKDKLCMNNLLFRIKNSINSPVLLINMDWQTYSSILSKRFRSAMRNGRNKIERIGKVSINKIIEYPLCVQMLPLAWEIGQKSWKHKIQRAIASTDSNRDFFSKLTEIAGQNGWLNLWVLLVNEKPVAFEYHLNYKNKIHGLRAEFSEDLRSHSPGTVLDSYIVENLFQNGTLEYDMGGSEDFYKKRWTPNLKRHKKVFIYNNHLYSRLLYTLEFRLITPLSKVNLFRVIKNELFLRAKRIYQDEGLIGLIKRSLAKPLATIYTSNCAIWFRRDLNDKFTEHKPKIDLKVRFKNRDATLKWIKSLGQEWMCHPKEIEIAKKEDHLFLSVHHSKKIIGYLKVGFNKVYIQDFQKDMSFRPERAFIYDTYVLPEFRGLGVTPFLVTECMKFLKKHAYRQVLCHIPPWNSASIKAYSKVGFKAVRKICFINVFGFKFFTFNPEHL